MNNGRFFLFFSCLSLAGAYIKKLPPLNILSKVAFATPLSELKVDLDERSYPIYTGKGLLRSGELLRKHVASKKALIVTNTVVGPFYSARVRESLEAKGVEVFEVILPDGEEFKTMDVLMMIIDAAMDHKLDRKSTMIALGGGVIGDMCGFAASIYQRGIKFVQIPTTLMAMVDSAVGGKTAVNHPKGKNMIGAFYQPDAVIIDLDTLDTLQSREFVSGIAEVIKYGLIRDSEFFDWQEENMEKILRRDPSVLVHLIERSCQNKAAVVAADEKEGSSGVRATLNFGHTFGHAIESGLGYGAWLHGEAVATGMLMASELSHKLGLMDESLFIRTRQLLISAGLPISLRDNICAEKEAGAEPYSKLVQALTSKDFLEYMSMDKKVADGQLSLVLLESSKSSDSGRLACNALVTDRFDFQQLEAVVTKYCDNR